jgi:ubiquinone/menaquinone biosynthesis C-methylase UbiE
MGNRHDYLPAAGHDLLLPAYDLISRFYRTPRIHDRLIDQADLTGVRRILEIGCGTGNLTIKAKRARPEAEVTGIDPDPKALTLARRKARDLTGISFEQAYAQQLPYPDGTFDRVLSSLMLHHIDEDAKAAAAAEVARVLRPGGRLHLADIGGHMTADDGFFAKLILRNHHVAGNLGEAIPRLLTMAGLDCDEVASARHPRMGRITFYRATRPA